MYKMPKPHDELNTFRTNEHFQQNQKKFLVMEHYFLAESQFTENIFAVETKTDDWIAIKILFRLNNKLNYAKL